MRILQIAPPWFTVPPAGYGGIERVVAALCDGLVDAGHDVTLLASGGSTSKAEVVSVFDTPPSSDLGSTSHELTHVVAGYNRRHEFDVMSGAEATLFPIAWPEPFGLVMIESMAVGTPVIAYSGGASVELIAPGETGYLLPTGDLEGMVAAVATVGQLDRAACRAHVQRRFSSEAMVSGDENVFSALTRPVAQRPLVAVASGLRHDGPRRLGAVTTSGSRPTMEGSPHRRWTGRGDRSTRSAPAPPTSSGPASSPRRRKRASPNVSARSTSIPVGVCAPSAPCRHASTRSPTTAHRSGHCQPQAWSAGAAILALHAVLGIEPDVPAGVVHVRPMRPAPFARLTMEGMPLAGGRLSLALEDDLGLRFEADSDHHALDRRGMRCTGMSTRCTEGSPKGERESGGTHTPERGLPPWRDQRRRPRIDHVAPGRRLDGPGRPRDAGTPALPRPAPATRAEER